MAADVTGLEARAVLRFVSCECEESVHVLDPLEKLPVTYWEAPDVPTRVEPGLRMAVDSGHVFGAVVQYDPAVWFGRRLMIGEAMTPFGKFRLCEPCRLAEHMTGRVIDDD